MLETSDRIEIKLVPLVDGPVAFAGAVSLEVRFPNVRFVQR